MRRSALTRKAPRRPLTMDSYLNLRKEVFIRDNGICIGVKAGIAHPCKGPEDAEHLVEQQAIRRMVTVRRELALADPRLAVACCRWLNVALHSYGWIKLTEDADNRSLSNIEKDARARLEIRKNAPEGFEEAVMEYGLESAAAFKLGELDDIDWGSE